VPPAAIFTNPSVTVTDKSVTARGTTVTVVESVAVLLLRLESLVLLDEMFTEELRIVPFVVLIGTVALKLKTVIPALSDKPKPGLVITMPLAEGA